MEPGQEHVEKPRCENTETCPMFKYFRRVAQEVYRNLYCEGDFEICARRRLRLAGQPVPANLLPHGGKLWLDTERPPELWEV